MLLIWEYWLLTAKGSADLKAAKLWRSHVRFTGDEHDNLIGVNLVVPADFRVFGEYWKNKVLIMTMIGLGTQVSAMARWI